MKQYQINKAYVVMAKLSQCELPVRVAHDLYMLRCALEPHYKFAAERDRKLLKQYEGRIGSDGQPVFDTEEQARKFYDELAAGNNLEIELNWDTASVPYDAMDNCRLTPDDIAALDGLVVFE